MSNFGACPSSEWPTVHLELLRPKWARACVCSWKINSNTSFSAITKFQGEIGTNTKEVGTEEDQEEEEKKERVKRRRARRKREKRRDKREVGAGKEG